MGVIIIRISVHSALRCTNFLKRADAGVIRLDDLTVDAHHAGHKEVHALREKTAMVFQHYNLFRRNATWQGEVRWLERNERELFRSARELIEMVGGAAAAESFPRAAVN